MSQSTNHLSATPLLAPLSQPMIHQILLTHKKQIPSPPAHIDLHTQLSHTTSEFIATWINLQQQVEHKRAHAYSLIKEAIEENTLNTRWLIEQVSRLSPQKKKAFSAETFSRWRTEGLLRYQKDNLPDTDSATALLTLRLLSTHKQNAWMPKSTHEKNAFWQEPLWWCWRQDSPRAPIIPCPIPFPSDLPSHSLLWTDWLGAEWKPLWLRLGSLGCCRWAGTCERNNTLIWAMTEEDLEIWGIQITEAYRKALDNDAPITRHILAQTTLLNLATERLDTLKTFKKAPYEFLQQVPLSSTNMTFLESLRHKGYLWHLEEC